MGLFFTYLGAVDLGLIWGFLALGVYITFRLLDVADLTVDGSFATGGAVCAVCLLSGMPLVLSLLLSCLAGFAAGLVTGFLHTICKIPAILSGILTQIGLYSINLRIMGGRANLPLTSVNTLFNTLARQWHINKYYVAFGIGLLFIVVVIAALYYFFGTELGSAIRATGNNEHMARALGINTHTMKLVGLMISNGLVALSGALYALYGQATDVRSGTGAIVIALASIVIGETLLKNKKNHFALSLTFVVLGSIVYRLVVAFILQLGLATDDLKLLTALLVAASLTIPTWVSSYRQQKNYKKQTDKGDCSCLN